MKFFTFFIYFFSYSFFLNFIFIFIQNNGIYDFTKSIQFIVDDFSRVSFPYEFSLSLNFIVYIFALIFSFYAVKKYKNYILKNLEEKIYEVLTIFLANFLIISGIFYFIRIYNFPRSYLLLITVINTLITLFLFHLIKIVSAKENQKTMYIKVGAIFTIIFLAYIGYYYIFSSEKSISQNVIVENLKEDDFQTIGLDDSSNIESNTEIKCFDWFGSTHELDCRSIVNYEKINFQSDLVVNDINNLIIFENNLFLIESSGLIYNLSQNSEFLNIKDKVNSRSGLTKESGLWDIAFHPSENYFLVSYSNKSNFYTISRFKFNNLKNSESKSEEILLEIPNPIESHYSGSLIYSNYFSDFIYSVGDMNNNQFAEENLNPIDTSSIKGKVLLLNTKLSEPEQLTVEKNNLTRDDILVYGVRNPWQIYEYDNLLIVPDVGRNLVEEINIIELDNFKKNNTPTLLGWPYYEGNIENEVLFDGLKLWNNTSKSLKDFVDENTQFPDLYYDHETPEVFRAAVIFGGVVENSESIYYQSLVFADYLSKEIFIFNPLNNSLFIFNLPQNLKSEFTAVTALIVDNSNDKLKLYISSNESIYSLLLEE